MIIRQARREDLPAILEIYNHVIETSTAVYTERAVDLENRIAWFEQRTRDGHPILVAEREGEVLGFSSYTHFRPWWGYRYTVEHMVHVRDDCRGSGIGRALVSALFPIAAGQGHHAMIGGIDAANEASIRFHERMGFREVGRLPEVGHKFGRWLDLVFMQRFLDAPGSPRD